MARSILFTPATRLDRLDRALASGADFVALDLEDGVGADEKKVAREALTALAGAGLGANRERIAVRVNSLGHPDGVRDLAAILEWVHWPALLILPKVESPTEPAQAVSVLAALGSAPRLLITLETARGIEEAAAIASAAPPDSMLAYGSADHMAETGGQGPAALAYGRGRIVNAAALAGIPALDGVWLDYRDEAGLRAEAELAKSLGFAGKIAIHPDQVATIREVFTPTEKEIAAARALLAAASGNGGAFGIDGRMVDAPILSRAKRILAASEMQS